MERAEISKRNKYYISKHRYYELKHFCLQYPEWKKGLVLMNAWSRILNEIMVIDSKGQTPSNPTEKIAIARLYFKKRIDILDKALESLDKSIAPYVKVGVTEGVPYDVLRARGCPCGRDMYYEQYRKFFWVLSTENT